MEHSKITEMSAKKSFYIYNTPDEYIFVPCRNGLYKITVIGGGGGGFGGGGFLEEGFPYQSSGGGGGATSIALIELTANHLYRLTVGSGGLGGKRSSTPGAMNCGNDGGKSIFDKFLTADGGNGGYHHLQKEYVKISGCGGKASGGDININGGDGKCGYYLTSEKAYSSPIKSGGDSTHGTGAVGYTYKQIRQRSNAFRHIMISNGNGVKGLDGQGYGAGGGGAGFYSFNKSGYAGGDGSCGLIIIEESGS